ncbi:5488_t:CDS:2 [Entrophospora sp. SA101]|nr:11671_t:CDS:2 [Entrophospora sp. SA101]CAJ0627740.1 5488_t:CDS:2 [Entrophospora sp. SA101]CAJ0833242.1 14588_t:CDS:2 [Entrophospora sp. SA101]CAJ0843882.1 10319_t:CDS:2 [Entrophospora sp. SA101]CAJ0901503.1 3488_t:CDS:2 [Entrophospora sp. SA101]
MAKSRYEYVKSFEKDDSLLPNTWMVLRIDGRGFHKFSDKHKFEKPNDKAALDLMNKCAQSIMNEFHDIILAYGQILCSKKIATFMEDVNLIVSQFSSNYVYYWKDYLPSKELLYPPSFDGRIVIYPSDNNLRDYLSWRQGTVSSDKNELLFSKFNINYNKLPEMFRKGSLLIHQKIEEKTINQKGLEVTRGKNVVPILHVDIIKDEFWEIHLELGIKI